MNESLNDKSESEVLVVSSKNELLSFGYII